MKTNVWDDRGRENTEIRETEQKMDLRHVGVVQQPHSRCRDVDSRNRPNGENW